MSHQNQLPLIAELRPAPAASEVFRRLAGRRGCLFLDSSLRHAELGRYSYVACDPVEWFQTPAAEFTAGGPHALDRLRDRFQSWQTAAALDVPPFQGGVAGVFGYELARQFERLPLPDSDEFGIPAVAVGFYDLVFAFDHRQNRAWIVSQGLPELDLAARQRRATKRLAAAQRWLDEPPSAPAHALNRPCALQAHTVQLDGQLVSNFSADEYCAAVSQVIDYIRAGDIFQANLSQRLLHPIETNSVALYLGLRNAAPATFAGYFDAGDFQVISASPERFLSVRSRQVETRPIKGTRPKLSGPLADMYAGQELLGSQKDRAENVMIVDLLRNDLSRTCRAESVHVPVLCGLESYGYVQHLVSAVVGELRPECDVWELLATSFPGGSVTGAPKIRAMEIITQLERVPRGAYCGSLGYLSVTGDMDTNILIRTITASSGWWQMPVGGGIVVDSHPQREYEETWHKAAGLLGSIQKPQPG